MKPITKPITKQVQIQLKGDADAVKAAIALLHALNFINGSVWSQAIRKRGERSIMRIAARSIDIPCISTHPVSENESLN